MNEPWVNQFCLDMLASGEAKKEDWWILEFFSPRLPLAALYLEEQSSQQILISWSFQATEDPKNPKRSQEADWTK